MPAVDYSGVTGDIQKGYDYQRQKAAQQEGTNLQGQRDALARRAAALGNAPGGAFVKAEQQAGNDSAQRLQSANEGIDQAQNQELRGVKMTQLGQEYSTSERQATQDFQAQQNAIQRRLEEAGLTGTYNGQDTLAAKTAAQQNALAIGGLTGSYDGHQTLAAKTAADQHDLAIGGLTGSYNGQQTLAAKTAADQHALQVAGVTGSYGGSDTIQEQALKASNTQNTFENQQNLNTNALNAIQSMYGAGWKREDISNMISTIYPNFDQKLLGPGFFSSNPVSAPPTSVRPTSPPPSQVAQPGDSSRAVYGDQWG